MILNKITLSTGEAIKQLTFDISKHNSTWEHYCSNYSRALKAILNHGLKKDNFFNPRAKPILFLLRHYTEINLKRNYYSKVGIPIINSHDFKVILDGFKKGNMIIPNGYLNLINFYNHDSDGASYKYHLNKLNNKPFFSHDERIILVEPLREFINVNSSDDFIIDDICPPFDYEDKNIIWALTLHAMDWDSLGVIKTQYDEVIGFLLEMIIHDKIHIHDIYLPLLFLIRHSIEIGLKSNIQEAIENYSFKTKKNIRNIHSIEQLYNLFIGDNGYKSLINFDKMSQETLTQFNDYSKQLENLKTIMHELDVNSEIFRFPVNRENNENQLHLEKDTIYKIINLYYLTDTFISYTNVVIDAEGLI